MVVLAFLSAMTYKLFELREAQALEEREACWAKHCSEPYEPLYTGWRCECIVVPR